MKKIILIIVSLLVLSCELYDMSDVMVERRYTIVIEHCGWPNNFSTIAENIEKHNKAPMEFYVKNCSLYYKVYAYEQHPEKVKMIFDHAYRFNIDGKNSQLYKYWKDTIIIN